MDLKNIEHAVYTSSFFLADIDGTMLEESNGTTSSCPPTSNIICEMK